MCSLENITTHRRLGHRACVNTTTTSLLFVLVGCLLASEEVSGTCAWPDAWATNSHLTIRAPESFHLSWTAATCTESTITGYVLQPVAFRSLYIDAFV